MRKWRSQGGGGWYGDLYNRKNADIIEEILKRIKKAQEEE